MADRRKIDAEGMSLSDMVNQRVDEELEGYERAFERLAALKQQEAEDERRRTEKEDCAA